MLSHHSQRTAGLAFLVTDTTLLVAQHWSIYVELHINRRPGLCAAEPGGDGGAVHAAGGALRAGQRAGDEQPAVLGLGADLQGPDDDGGGDRPAGASQRDRGAERAQLPCRVGETGAGARAGEGGVREGEGRPGWGSGCAAVAVAALRLPPLRQTPTPAGLPWVRGEM